MTKHIRTQHRNKFRGTAAPVGTPARTPQRYGGSPFGSKENRLPCSCVPNLSYISKDIKNMAVTPAKHAYTRVKGFFRSWNAGGGHYA